MLSLLGALLSSELAFGTRACVAQSVTPEQRLSTTVSNLYFNPELRADQARVFGVWGGMDGTPHNISYGYSLNQGTTWTNEATLPLTLSGNGTNPPFALTLDGQGAADLMVLTSTHYFYRKPLIGSADWLAPVRAVTSDGYPDDVQSIACDQAMNSIYFAYTHKLDSYNYPVRFIRSLDNGLTWSAPTALSSPNCNGSSMAVGPDGNLYVTWVDFALGRVVLRKSVDLGATFSAPMVVTGIFDNLNAVPPGWHEPPYTYTRDYPYYREGIATGAPNFPALAVDRSNNPSRGTLYLTWAEHAEGAPAPATATFVDSEPNDDPASAQLVALDSNINGSLWTGGHTGPVDRDWFAFDGTAGQTIQLDGDSPSTYGTGCQLFEQLPDGNLLPLAWLIMPGSQALANGAHGKPPIVTLPRTGRYLLGLTGNILEAPYYFLRLRTWQVAPTSVARDMRDIVLIRSTDGGTTWSPRVRVNHDVGGADQHQPNVAVDGQGRVYVAWYDRRGSAYGNEVRPYATVSVDGGATFGPDLPLASVASNWTGLLPGDPSDDGGFLVGDRIALAAGDDFGMVAWTDLRVGPNYSDIYAARIVDVPTAVAAVSDLAAEPVAIGVRIHWHVNDPQGLSDLEVLRSEGGGEEALVGAVTVTGRTGEAEYLDGTVEPGREYRYRLRFSSGGATQYLGPVVVRTPAQITTLAWRATGPNPFADRATVTLAVPRAEAALVRVYDVQGKVVRTLHEGRLEAGERQLEWDGRDAAGADAAPGLYFVAAQAGGETARAKLTRVR